MQPDLPSDSSNLLLLRAICCVLALIASSTAAAELLGLARRGFDPLLAIFAACTLLFVAMCAWFALRGNRAASRARMRLVLMCGLVVGGISFAIGFFGPLIWSPGANQGPLLGIFVTGPLGFVAGAVLGWLYARVRAAQAPARG